MGILISIITGRISPPDSKGDASDFDVSDTTQKTFSAPSIWTNPWFLVPFGIVFFAVVFVLRAYLVILARNTRWKRLKLPTMLSPRENLEEDESSDFEDGPGLLCVVMLP